MENINIINNLTHNFFFTVFSVGAIVFCLLLLYIQRREAKFREEIKSGNSSLFIVIADDKELDAVLANIDMKSEAEPKKKYKRPAAKRK